MLSRAKNFTYSFSFNPQYNQRLRFFGGKGHAHDMWKLPGQGSNPRYSHDRSHSSDNARSLTTKPLRYPTWESFLFLFYKGENQGSERYAQRHMLGVYSQNPHPGLHYCRSWRKGPATSTTPTLNCLVSPMGMETYTKGVASCLWSDFINCDASEQRWDYFMGWRLYQNPDGLLKTQVQGPLACFLGIFSSGAWKHF